MGWREHSAKINKQGVWNKQSCVPNLVHSGQTGVCNNGGDNYVQPIRNECLEKTKKGLKMLAFAN